MPTTARKRHRWPQHDHPYQCRAGDRCLDCGIPRNEAARGPSSCHPVCPGCGLPWRQHTTGHEPSPAGPAHTDTG